MEEDREELWLQYAGVLAEAYESFAGFAWTHGLKSDPAAVRIGERLRGMLNITPADQKAAAARAREFEEALRRSAEIVLAARVEGA